jgi:hypothetical protein
VRSQDRTKDEQGECRKQPGRMEFEYGTLANIQGNTFKRSDLTITIARVREKLVDKVHRCSVFTHVESSQNCAADEPSKESTDPLRHLSRATAVFGCVGFTFEAH